MNQSRALAILIAILALSLGGCGESPMLVVRGTLVGSDGAPMPLAHVHLLRPMEQPLASAEVDMIGRFEVTTVESGPIYLQFTGVGHARKEVWVVVEVPVELDLEVRLAAREYVDDMSGVKVIGDFNDFEVDSARDMMERPDGSFALEVETEADTLAYQLSGLAESGRSINGTHSDSYAYDDDGDYRSVLQTEGGKVTIAFDPAKLARSDAPASVTFSDPGSTQARLASWAEELDARFAEWSEARDEAAEAGEELDYDWSSTVEDLGERAGREEDPLVRQALYYGLLLAGSYGADLDAAGWERWPEAWDVLAQQALEGVPPTSHLWSDNPFALNYVVAAAFNSIERDAESPGESEGVSPAWLEDYVAYMEEGSAAHPDEDVRAFMLAAVVWAASEAEDEDLGREYNERLLADYPESFAADLARTFAPDRNIQLGKMIPEYSFASLDDSTLTVSRESLLGTTYLMDFWATWCTPCVAELPGLHELYEEYEGQGFQIVSLSFDEDPEEVIEFRQGRWEMPWLHVHVPDPWEGEAMHPFEVWGIPKAILVDADGLIVGTDGDVRGEELQETLARFLAEGPEEGATD